MYHELKILIQFIIKYNTKKSDVPIDFYNTKYNAKNKFDVSIDFYFIEYNIK